MSASDRKVKPLTDNDVREHATRTKRSLGIYLNRPDGGEYRTWPVDIRKYLQQRTLMTVDGIKKMQLEILYDEKLGSTDARTSFSDDGKTIFIEVKDSVWRDAGFGDGRSRMTLAHELGHAVLHVGQRNAVLEREMGASGVTVLSQNRAFESAEHQAKVFASEFLIHPEELHRFSNPQKIAVEFQISLEAARIAYDRVSERQRVNTKFAKLLEELEGNRSTTAQSQYLEQPCPKCGGRTVREIGVKFFCATCENVFDDD